MSKIIIRDARPDDLRAVCHVQHEAFTRVSEELQIPACDLPPLRESVQDLLSLHSSGMRFYVALDGPQIVGSVRARAAHGTAEVGRLVVSTDHLRQGIASSLMRFLEVSLPDVHRFELFTGADAIAPLALYEQLGYARTRIESTSSVELVWLEKEVPHS